MTAKNITTIYERIGLQSRSIVVMTLVVIMGWGGASCGVAVRLPYIHKMSRNRCRRSHGWTHKVSTPTTSLTTFKVAVAGGGTALAFGEIVAVHGDTHAAAGFAPLEAG